MEMVLTVTWVECRQHIRNGLVTHITRNDNGTLETAVDAEIAETRYGRPNPMLFPPL